MIINLLLQIYIAKADIENIDETMLRRVISIEAALIELLLWIKLVQWVI